MLREEKEGSSNCSDSMGMECPAADHKWEGTAAVQVELLRCLNLSFSYHAAFRHVFRRERFCTPQAMLSPSRASNLVACARSLSFLSFNRTRSFASSTSNGNRPKSGQAPKFARESPEPESNPLPPPLIHRVASDGGNSLVTSLDHYSGLPPLPPIDKWLSHFPYAQPVVRDRISIRDPASAIHVAQSFINSKKTSTGNPKVIIEAFPGAWHLNTPIALFLRPI